MPVVLLGVGYAQPVAFVGHLLDVQFNVLEDYLVEEGYAVEGDRFLVVLDGFQEFGADEGHGAGASGRDISMVC